MKILGVLFPNLPTIPTAISTVALTTLTGILTGIFLVIKILALVVLVWLGFFHAPRPITNLIANPAILSNGHFIHAPFAAPAYSLPSTSAWHPSPITCWYCAGAGPGCCAGPRI